MSLAHILRRRLSSLPARPWFVLDTPGPSRIRLEDEDDDAQPEAPAIDASIPASHPLRTLSEHLRGLPLLEARSIQIGRPLPIPAGPALPFSSPRGRRRRGSTYAGEGLPLPGSGDIWDWVVLATVKEGTEGRGAVDAVLRTARKLLQEHHPDVPLPRAGFARRSRGTDGWGMLDAGDFAVHVLSREARERWFAPPPEQRH
ncbi:hypothetical protein EXIGLDRAFT_606152 [Exidia glandulosa HHB12029]|uniref:Uncharacterized protein n=1 Tax=Exidia glandulosa HHB12029 TaxID=1314781 RepID=A0A165MDF2_EXIGL|nr:hypothetical protein EXIGLDRAFT_606152 [Exidia glandulosa HHB12029]